MTPKEIIVEALNRHEDRPKPNVAVDIIGLLAYHGYVVVSGTFTAEMSASALKQ